MYFCPQRPQPEPKEVHVFRSAFLQRMISESMFAEAESAVRAAMGSRQ